MKTSELIKFLQRADEDTEVEISKSDRWGAEKMVIKSCSLCAGADGICQSIVINTCEKRDEKEDA